MKYFPLLMVLVAMASCGSPAISEKTLQADAAMLAIMQCEAQELQEERFKLANDIRMLEDSIMTTTDTVLLQGYQAKLDMLTPRKDDMWLRTKAMADSISNTLTHLHQGTYKDTADRKLLDVALNTEFERVCL